MLAVTLTCAAPSSAQISLSTAVNLALQNSPRVKIAQSDLGRARAVLAETHEAFVPAVSTTAGVGRATGAPLSPPVIFSVAAQSLVYNFSQPDYIRAAHSGVTSAQLALAAARSDAAEDVTNAYIALDNAIQRRALQADALAIAQRLVTIVEDRYNAGVDPHIELTRARRTATELRLQQLLVNDEIENNQEHLALLTGLGPIGLLPLHDSIPAFRTPTAPERSAADNPANLLGVSAAFASAQSRQFTAHGETRYMFRPQISFSAQYSRISDAFTSYDFYYPGFRQRIVCSPTCVATNQLNSFNSLSLGVQLTVPLLDMVHRARARESAADAVHALFEAQVQQNSFIEGRQRLRHSAAELSARADLASLDHDLAQDQLDAVLIRLQAAAGTAQGEQMTPKDAENARLAERQRSIDMLNADLQLRQAEVSLLRQEGSLTDWLAATIPGATAAPAAATPETRPPLPATLGAQPGAVPGTAAPLGTAPASVPTTGTAPSTLPSAPDSVPSAPPSAPAVPDAPAPVPSTPAPVPAPGAPPTSPQL